MLEAKSKVSILAGTRIGVDLGGTNMSVGCLDHSSVITQGRYDYDAQGSQEEILELLCDHISHHWQANTQAIGIGVPSVLDEVTGVVYEVANIPSWQMVPLKQILEDRFGVPVAVNNDVNCFVLGEHLYGAAKGLDHVVGMCLGTGLGVGLVINGKLYGGNTCGAGELGEMPYKDGVLENYCSGQFFKKFHQTTGAEVYKRAQLGDTQAQAIFDEFGRHVGQAISTALLAYDPQMVVLGGSVSQAMPLFEEGIRQALSEFPFPTMLSRCKIERGSVDNAAIWGAASLVENK